MSKAPWLKANRSVIPMCVMAAAGLLPALEAKAQTAPPAEVVVTAERRAVNLQKAPLAVTVVPATELDKSFVTQISDLNSSVPSLQETHASGLENLVSIRGIGDNTPENTPTTTPGVSLFIDGVYIANNISLDETLFDLDNIEVLRGPQGALYGQSSIGGVINIVSKQPVLHQLSGSADFSVGDYNLTRERAELNIPINDDLALRISGQKYDHDGFTKDGDIPGFTLDDAHDYTLKGSLLWKPYDDFSATLTAQYYKADEHGSAMKNVLEANPDPRTVYQDFPGHFGMTSQLYHLNLNYDAPWFEVKSVSAYQSMNSPVAFDSSRSAVSLIGSYDDVPLTLTDLQNYSESIDLISLPGSPLTWDVGAFAQNQHVAQTILEYEGDGAPGPMPTDKATVLANPSTYLGYANINTVQRFSYSVYGQFTYPILSELRLTGGARYNYDGYSQDSFNFSFFDPKGGVTVSRAFTSTVPTGVLRLDWDATPINLVYASLTRGYKPGGVNGTYGQVIIPPTFQPETNTAIELGAKNRFFDNAVTLNVAGFYYWYDNMQYIESDPVPFDGGISNIPKVNAYGVEAEASYRSPDHKLHINGNLAWEKSAIQGTYKTLDSTVVNSIENTYAPCLDGGAYYMPSCWARVVASEKDIGGNNLPFMPEWSGSANASYDFDIPWGMLTPRVEVVYRGDMWARIFNEPALDHVPAYTVVNLNLTYAPTASHFVFSLQANNVGDVAGINSQYTDPYGTGTTSRQYIPPRQVIGTIAYSF